MIVTCRISRGLERFCVEKYCIILFVWEVGITALASEGDVIYVV